MSLPILLVLGLVTVAAFLLVTERLRPDLIALLLLVALGLTGLVPAKDLFSGFSNKAVMTIIALFIITAGLERTGVTRLLGRHLHRVAGEDEARAVFVFMAASASLSLVMNTIAAAAVLLPAAIGLTRQTRLRPSRLLIPLSFGALLGGMATLFTTANILVSAALADSGLRPYGVFDFVPVGLPMALAGIAFMVFVGRKLLPARGPGDSDSGPRPSSDLSDAYGLKSTVLAAYVKPGSSMAGLSLAEGGWGGRLGLNIVGISRGGSVRLAPPKSEEVLEGDIVLFTGNTDEEELERYGLVFTQDPAWQGQFASEDVSLVEATLAPRSAIAGKTLREIDFRDKYEVTLLAIWREGTTIREGLGDLPLRFGDALLMQGRRSKTKLLRADPDFLVLEEDTRGLESRRKAALAIGLTIMGLTLPAFNILPIAESAFAAATLMILFNCLSMDEAYSAIEWKAIFLIAGMLPLGLAITSTGTATFIGNTLVTWLGGLGPLAIAAGLFLLSMLLTQVLSGQVTAVVLAPIAIAAARRVGADPRAIAMTVALGCSMAFLSPLGHATNMLVMGPGGYTFKDYPRVGWPLTVLLFFVMLAGLALFWGVR